MEQNQFTIQHDEQGNAGWTLTQDDLRKLVIGGCKFHHISLIILGKMTEIDPDILQSWQNGAISLEPEAFDLIFAAFAKLHQGTSHD